MYSRTNIGSLERRWEEFSQKACTPSAAEDLVKTLHEYTGLLKDVDEAYNNFTEKHKQFMSKWNDSTTGVYNDKKNLQQDPPPTVHSIAELDEQYTKLCQMYENIFQVLSGTCEIPGGTLCNRNHDNGGGDGVAGGMEALLNIHQEANAIHNQLMNTLNQGFRLDSNKETK